MTGLALILAAAGWYTSNIWEDKQAGEQALDLLDKLTEYQPTDTEQGSVSVIVVDGDAFCGRVIISKLGIELPVFEEWNDARLKEAPCRYSGSISTDDMIIAAHNYKSHFGNLKSLQTGDEIVFIDAYGSEHRYEVKELVTLDGSAVTDMKSGEWDFTLFTCTKGGEQRVTVRCDKISDNES